MDIIIIDGKEYDLDAVTPEVREELLKQQKLAEEVAKLFGNINLAKLKAGQGKDA